MKEFLLVFSASLLLCVVAVGEDSHPEMETQLIRVRCSLSEAVSDYKHERQKGCTNEIDRLSFYDTTEDDWKKYMTLMGVTWPTGSSVQYLAAIGRLRIHNTPENIRTFRAVVSDTDCAQRQIELELQFVEFKSTEIENLARTNGISTASLLNLWAQGKGSLLSVPHIVTKSGAETRLQAFLPVKGENARQLPISATITVGQETGLITAVSCDLFSSTIGFEVGDRVLVGGGFHGSTKDSVAYVFATVWFIDFSGQRYPLLSNE